ncbi:MAG: 4-vinyl reductase [Syntrophomonadaceae bacterium]|nr:4-vinyl reductase [Syntrophomonadaceae bacterium]
MYKYKDKNVQDSFGWSVLGDVKDGRNNLGEYMSVYTYRLFQFATKNVLIEEIGAEKAIEIFRKSGYLGGYAFAEEFLDKDQDFNQFVAQLQAVMKEQLIGIVKLESADLEKMHLILAVAEDLDCSGLPVTDESVCDYDEGFIAGILAYYTGKEFDVREIDCWATGGRVCRFDVQLKG